MFSSWSETLTLDELVDGEKDTVIGITPIPRGKKTTPQPNYSTVTEWFGRVFKLANTISQSVLYRYRSLVECEGISDYPPYLFD